jgi:hypothetical protein
MTGHVPRDWGEKLSTNTEINYPITEERVFCVLTSAFEGGSNYWISSVEIGDDKTGVPRMSWTFVQDIPLVGGCLEITDDEGNVHALNKDKLCEGLKTMATKFQRHFMDLITENDDAETGDVFLQCCLFGDVIYG